MNTEANRTKAARFYDERVEEWQRSHTSPDDFWYRGNTLASNFLSRYLTPGARSLEIGCAAGQLSELLHREGHIVFGVDVSPNMVEASCKRLSGLGVPSDHFQCCQTYSLPFDDNSFDVVAALGVLPYVENQPRYLREVYRVLKPGGLAFFSNVNRGSLFVKVTLIRSFPKAFGGRFLVHRSWFLEMYNYVRTGLHAGTFVDLSKAVQARSADMIDRFFKEAGFSIEDTYDMYNLRRLDQNPFDRKGFSAWAARKWAWIHFGLYRKGLF